MPTKIELWLVRHGETTANQSSQLSGWSDVPLTARGIEQARALRLVLAGRRFDAAWCSDLERARSTAAIAWPEPAQPDRRLREMNFGELEGADWYGIADELRQGIMDFEEDVAAPGGETFAALRSRVLEFVESLPQGRHLVFTHGGVIRLLTRDIGHDKFLGNGGVIALDWRAQTVLYVSDPDPAPRS